MLKSTSRIFTFGCSFTEFPWPTWADIIIEHAESEVPGVVGENWGRTGAGNTFIASRIWECHAKNKLTSDDYVFICWSSIFREDRHINGNWITNGELLRLEDGITPEFVLKYTGDVNSKYNMLKDCALIQSTHLALQQLGVNVIHFTMIGLTQGAGAPWVPKYDSSIDTIAETFDIQFDGLPMMQVLDLKDQSPKRGKNRLQTYWPALREDWPETDPAPEWHPTPKEHLTYLEQEIIHKVDFLKQGINEAGKLIVTRHMAIINALNKKPLKLHRGITMWPIPKSITEKW